MSRVFYIVLFVGITIGIQPALARPRHEPRAAAPAASWAGTDHAFLHDIRNNEYILESQRLVKLAEEAYQNSDYDASARYAEEAIYYAQLSDEYVAMQLKIKETIDAIAAAKTRLDWAVSTGASGQFPAEYGEAETWYAASLNARSNEDWDKAYEAAGKVVDLLAFIQVPEGLPASYTVRSWNTFNDCFWNIAGRPWVYGDSYRWRVLYNANRSRLPDPENPDLIEPGIVLDIPSIQGEIRQGEWEAGRTYDSLR